MTMPLYWDFIYGNAYLRFNYRGIGNVKLGNDGKWHHVIYWQGKEHRGIAGSQQQAMRWMERWCRARKGLPVIPKRRSSR